MADSQAQETRGTRRRSQELPPDLRLVLVGKTGSGKSSSGNTILGGDVFRAAVSRLSVTTQCCKKKREVFRREVTIIDTPGLFDTSKHEENMKREISKCIKMSAPGPHAILLVIKLGPFTAEERDAVKKVEQVFGEDAWKYTIILFTHGDGVRSDFEEVVKEANPELQEILEKVENRYHIFNNLKANDRGQVLDMLEKVDNMVSANRGQCYSNYTYMEVVEMLDRREKELREFYKKKLEEEIKAVESKYEKKLREAQEERQKVESQCRSELEELKRYYQTLESGVRWFIEETEKTDSTEFKFHETLKLN